MHPTVKRFCYAIAVLLLLAPSASAGVLDGNAMALLSGNHVFNGTKAQLSANVDYAVFEPGDFHVALGLPLAEDPSAGTQLVYAYEIFNTGVSILSFSIGLNSGSPPPDVITSATNFGDAPSGGGSAPSYFPPGLTGFFVGGSGFYSNVKWTFLTNIPNAGHSNFLVFTSPYYPGLDTASFVASTGDQNPALTDYLPSPVVPEPSTLVLSAGAAFGLFFARYLRRRRV
jgi:hypothetical protein